MLNKEKLEAITEAFNNKEKPDRETRIEIAKAMNKIATDLQQVEKLKTKLTLSNLDEIMQLIEKIVQSLKDVQIKASLSDIDLGTINKIIDQMIEAPPMVKIKKPSQYVIPNSKLANEMPKDIVNAGNVGLEVFRNKGAAALITYVEARLPIDASVTFTSTFTEFDRIVNNAVTSLICAGNKILTANSIADLISGGGYAKHHSNLVNDIENSLEKQRKIDMIIDARAEFQARKITLRGNAGLIRDAVLNYRIRPVRINNNTVVNGYEFLSVPAIYFYSNAIGQMLSAPPKLLDTSTHSSVNKPRLVARDYLLRRIQVMKHDVKNHSNRIRYESVYEEVGMLNANKVQKKRIRDYCKKVLDQWLKEGFIKGFKENEDRIKDYIDIKF